MNLEIITTSDGSHSLRNNALNETYHSVHGAMQESIHVFIKNGFDFIAANSDHDEIRMLEIGFGTGLNAWLTWQSSQQTKKKINYTSLEAFPVPEEIWSKLNYTTALPDSNAFRKLHEAPWNVQVDIEVNFTLHKLHTTLQQVQLPADFYDVIYFDAFAPSKQPEMWTFEILEKVVSLMRTGGAFVTYCAKGQLKRDLKTLGLHVETLEGPPGKKEMVRGSKSLS